MIHVNTSTLLRLQRKSFKNQYLSRRLWIPFCPMTSYTRYNFMLGQLFSLGETNETAPWYNCNIVECGIKQA